MNVNNDADYADEWRRTYIVADVQYVGELWWDVGVIARHERRVTDDTQSDEQVDERVHNEQFHVVRETIPARWTLPVEQQLVDLVHQFLCPRPIVFHLKRFCHPPQLWPKQQISTSFLLIVLLSPMIIPWLQSLTYSRWYRGWAKK